VRWIDSIDALDAAALPFLSHEPTQVELDSGSPDLPAAYNDFHLALLHCQTATNLLDTTGLFDSEAKSDPESKIATDELIGVFDGVLWAYYFSVIRYSPTEVAGYAENQRLTQPWGSAIREIEGNLSSEDVPEKYFPVFKTRIKELSPENTPLQVWQASDSLLDFCKSQIAKRYVWLMNSRFSWRQRSLRR
jgi:hypothetical protein